MMKLNETIIAFLAIFLLACHPAMAKRDCSGINIRPGATETVRLNVEDAQAVSQVLLHTGTHTYRHFNVVGYDTTENGVVASISASPETPPGVYAEALDIRKTRTKNDYDVHQDKERDKSHPLNIIVDGPSAQAFATEVFFREKGKPTIVTRLFDVPNAGSAVLRVVNGARVCAPVRTLVRAGEIRVNGKTYIDQHMFSRSFSNRKPSNCSIVIEKKIPLVAGTNKLEVVLDGKPKTKLSVRIDASADTLRLQPVNDTIVKGGTVNVAATLTGLGLPVTNWPVRFDVANLGDVPPLNARTNDKGKAQITLNGFETPGNGILRAKNTVGSPALSDSVPLKVIRTPVVGVRGSVSHPRIREGKVANVLFFVDLYKSDTSTYNATFTQTANPDNGGLSLSPGGSVPIAFSPGSSGTANRPRIKEVAVRIKALKPGRYTITSRVNLEGTGETTSLSLPVDVLPAEERIVLRQLTLQPGAIPTPGADGKPKVSEVKFRAEADGLRKPLEELSLEEFDPESKSWKLSGKLPYNGVDYLATLPVAATQEGQKLFRTSVLFQGTLRHSSACVLQMSPYKVGGDPTAKDIIGNKATEARFTAEVIIAGFQSNLHTAQIDTIVDEAARRAIEKTLSEFGHETQIFHIPQPAGRIGGFIPEIGAYQVRFNIPIPEGLSSRETNDLRVALIRNATDIFRLYDEVKYASADHELVPAGRLEPDGGENQWGAHRIGAPEAWDHLDGPNGAEIKIVAIDTSSNGDLGEGPNGPHEVPVTQVIHSLADSNGITGIAYGADYRFEDLNPCGDTKYCGAQKLVEVANAGFNIINWSWNPFFVNPSGNTENGEIGNGHFECAFRYAALPKGTAVGSATVPSPPTSVDCQGPLTTEGFEGQMPFEGHGALVVAAAGNIDNSQGGGQDLSGLANKYPCDFKRYGIELLCVGNAACGYPNNTDSLPCPDERPYEESNYGSLVDLFAPGTHILIDDGSHVTGTSFAAPHVSGAAGVVWSEMQKEFTNGNHALAPTSAAVRERLINSTEKDVLQKPDGSKYDYLNMRDAVKLRQVTINLRSAEADFNNIFGIYDTTTNEAQIIFHSIASNLGGETSRCGQRGMDYPLSRAQETHIGYFLIPNGGRINNSIDCNPDAEYSIEQVELDHRQLPNGSNNLTFCVKRKGDSECLLGNKVKSNGSDLPYAYFSEPIKNVDRAEHLKKDMEASSTDGAVSIKISWEDLYIPGGNFGDFNDAVLIVTFEPSY